MFSENQKCRFLFGGGRGCYLGFGFLSQVQLIVCFSEEEENTVLKPFLKRFLGGVMYTFQINGKLNSVNEA